MILLDLLLDLLCPKWLLILLELEDDNDPTRTQTQEALWQD